ncbi:MAG TPA: DUF2892 domain-containing protein [Acidobacteriota bacterium]|nr:DUF2892 domain-containing protein [Acidobacteriota bacterium]
MKSNVGSYDAGIRYVLGWLIVIWGVHTGNMWGWLALVPLITAAIAFCPLYCVFHVDTTSTDNHAAR